MGKEPDLFRFTLKHSIILTTVIACLTYLQSNVLHFLVPVYSRVATPVAAAAAGSLVKDGLLYLAITVAVVLAVSLASIALGKPTAVATDRLRKAA